VKNAKPQSLVPEATRDPGTNADDYPDAPFAATKPAASEQQSTCRSKQEAISIPYESIKDLM
jgi:hypothetical protein